MATKKISSKKAALTLAPETPEIRPRKPTPLSQKFERFAEIDAEFLRPPTTPKVILFTLERVLTWPEHMQKTLYGLITDDIYWSQCEDQRAKWRVKNHKRKQKAA